MSEPLDEDRAGEEEIAANPVKQLPLVVINVRPDNRERVKNRTFRSLRKPARSESVGADFRVAMFVDREFVSMGNYVEPHDAAELWLDAKRKGKLQLPKGEWISVGGRNIGKTAALKQAERDIEFEKEKVKCLNLLSRLATMIERARSEKEKTT